MKTREEWLTNLTDKLRSIFDGIGFPLPMKIRTSCGFPSKGALANKARRIGEAWSSEVSEDQHFETFVSPLLDDTIEVAAVQVHELCHCAAGLECKHRKPFTTIARKIGLEGKISATIAGEELKLTLIKMIEDLGPYPHAKLVHSSLPKKQSTRMILIKCPKPDCGYQVRTTRKWIDVGMPICPCGTEMKSDFSGDEENVNE